jgi:hypothetical protein
MEQPWMDYDRRRPRRPVTRRVAAVIAFLLVISGSALLGVAVIDSSALQGWVPASVVEVTPDRSVLRRWAAAFWDEVKAHLGVSSSAVAPPVSSAELQDYEFQLVQPELKQADAAVVEVRLLHKPSGRSVPDAIVFARRIDMAPDGMPTMTAPLEPVPATEPGTYRFKTNLMMEGGWQLSLAAKVQGETGTVQNRLVLKAVP